MYSSCSLNSVKASSEAVLYDILILHNLEMMILETLNFIVM